MLKIVRVADCKKAKHKKAVYVLVPGRVYTVGRKGSTISFEDDTSISRQHAELEIDHPIANTASPSLRPTVSLTDLGSKFGTFVNDGIDSQVKVPVRETNIISAGGRFRLGLQWNEYRIDYTPLIVTSSTLKDVSALKENVRSLGGHLVSEWREDSDFLAMEGIVLTIKVVGALIFGKRIVTPAYFEDYVKAVLEGIEQGGEYDLEPHLPNPNDYMPPLKERSLLGRDDLFLPSKSRRTIFKGKHFLLPDERALKNYTVIIHGGGGRAGLLAKADKVILLDNSTVIVGDEAELPVMSQGKAKLAIDIYLESGKRIVAEKEIGLAALNQDTSVFTNAIAQKPMRTLSQVFESQNESSETDVVVPEAQELSQHVFNTNTPLGRSVIEDSCPPLKREREGVDEDESAKRRRKEEKHEAEASTQMSTKQGSSVVQGKSKEKKLASLFCMSDSDDDEETNFKNTETSSSVSTKLCCSPTLRRSGRNRDTPSTAAGGGSPWFDVPPTQESEDEGPVPSGVCPASPGFYDDSSTTNPGQSLPVDVKPATNTRAKRRQDDEDDETQAFGSANHDTLNGAANKKRKVLQDTTVAAHKQTNGKENKQNRRNLQQDEVEPLGYEFVSLMLKESSRPRRVETTEDSGGVNFKRFRKSQPTFAHAQRPMNFTFAPHTAVDENGADEDVEEVDAFPSAGRSSNDHWGRR